MSTEALAHTLRDPDIYGQPAGTPVWPTQLAERILADPAPLLAALPDSAIEAEALRRFYPARHLTGMSDR